MTKEPVTEYPCLEITQMQNNTQPELESMGTYLKKPGLLEGMEEVKSILVAVLWS